MAPVWCCGCIERSRCARLDSDRRERHRLPRRCGAQHQDFLSAYKLLAAQVLISMHVLSTEQLAGRAAPIIWHHPMLVALSLASVCYMRAIINVQRVWSEPCIQDSDAICLKRFSMRRIQANCWSQAVTDASATGEERYGGSEYAATDLIEKKKLEIVCVRCARLSMELTLAAYTADCRSHFIRHLLHMHVTTQTMCSKRQSLSARQAHGPMDSAFELA
jgi:hypothetical protein